MSLRVNKENKVEYKYLDKPMVARKTIQKRSAMNENSNINILSNGMMRRLLNTKEDLGAVQLVW